MSNKEQMQFVSAFYISEIFNLYSHIYGNPNCSFYYPIFTGGHYVGSVRQDSLTKQVYIVPPGYSSDTLLYDFNLGIGDALGSGFLIDYPASCSTIAWQLQ